MNVTFGPNDAPKVVTWPGVTMRLVEIAYTAGDCIDFYIEDGRSFRVAGEGVDVAGPYLMALPAHAPYEMRFPGPPPLWPQGH